MVAILERRSGVRAEPACFLNHTQIHNDQLISGFVAGSADPYVLAGMMAGGEAYHLVKPLAFSGALRLLGNSPSVFGSFAARFLATSTAFSAEVLAFETSQRALKVKWAGEDKHLLDWSGENGIKNGLCHSAFSLGALKSAGVVTQSNNIVLQHALADLSMLSAHRAQSFLFSQPHSQISWTEELASAEVMQFQMMASASLLSPRSHLSSKALESSIAFDPGFKTNKAVSNFNSGEKQTLVFASSDKPKPRILPPMPEPPTRRPPPEPPTQQRPLPPRRPLSPTDVTLKSAAAAGPRVVVPVSPQVVIEVPQDPGDDPVSSDGLTMIGKAPQLSPGQALPIGKGDFTRREVLAETPKVVINFGTGVVPPSSGQSMIGRAPSVNKLGVFYEGQILLDRFRIIKRMGLEAGMSEVYLGYEESLNREVVIKILKPELNGNKITVERFKREGVIQSRVASPHITSVYANGEIEGTHFIVLEYLKGETLNEVMGRNKEGFPQSSVIEIALQIAKALKSIHENDVVHRDLKPDNIFLLKDGFVKLIDFGIAKLKGNTDPFIEESQRSPANKGRLTEVGNIFGTPHYMSPEQARGEDVDLRSDIYSLGVMIYEFSTGKYPYEGVDTTNVTQNVLLAHLTQSPISFKKIGVSNLSPAFEKFLKKCMAKNVNDRFQNADEVIAALNNLKKESERVARESTIIPPPPFISKRPVYLGVGAAGFLLVSALGLGFFVGRKKDGILGLDATSPEVSATGMRKEVPVAAMDAGSKLRNITLTLQPHQAQVFSLDASGQEKLLGSGPSLSLNISGEGSIRIRVKGENYQTKDLEIRDSSAIQLEPLVPLKPAPSHSALALPSAKPKPSSSVPEVKPPPSTTASNKEFVNPFDPPLRK